MGIHANCSGTSESLLVDYRNSLDLQQRLVGLRQRGLVGDLLWLLEHPPTITLGRAGGSSHLLRPGSELEERGVVVVESPRGGDITCHEPGQLVGYPIVDLGGPRCRKDIHLYLRRLEEGIIGVLTRLGIDGIRIEGRTGVWVAGSPPRKIAAMGVRCTRWVTSHGFALNFENDLAGFASIVPCGISDAGVTSLARELPKGEVPAPRQLRRLVHEELEGSLGVALEVVEGNAAGQLCEGGQEPGAVAPVASEPCGLKQEPDS